MDRYIERSDCRKVYKYVAAVFFDDLEDLPSKRQKL